MIDATDSNPVFLFARDPAASLALHASLRNVFHDVRVFDRSILGMRHACAMIRAGERSPCVLVIEQEVRDSASKRRLALTREIPELGALRVVVLGDPKDGEAERFAREDGADAFLAVSPDDPDASAVCDALQKFVSVLEFARVR
jgi:hypothetical protein